MATILARSGGGGGPGSSTESQSQEDIFFRILEQVQLNMLNFQSQFNDLNLKIEKLELVQKNLNRNAAGQASGGTSEKSSAGSSTSTITDQSQKIASQEITRLDGRIDVLVKEIGILKKDLMLEDYNDKSSLLETSWRGGLNSTSMVAQAGDDLDNDDEDEDTMNETMADQSASVLETTKTENEEDESNYTGGLGDDEEDGENEAITIQPEIYLDDYDQDDDDNTHDMNRIDEEDNSMDIDDDDQSNDMLDDQGEGGSEDDQDCRSAYFSYKGQRDNAIEYKIIKATGKHQCPLFPVCQVECLSRRNLMRHYYNTHASTVTFQCPVCGIGYARKDNLSKHYKKKHEDQYGPLQNAAAQARPRAEYEKQQQRMLLQQSYRMMGMAGATASNAAKTKPGPVPRGMTSGGGLQRPHRCHLCGISYNWRKNLNHHMKVKHGQLMPPGTRGPPAAPLVKPQTPATVTNYVTCRLCPTSFRTTEELARHYSIRHRAMGRPNANANTSSGTAAASTSMSASGNENSNNKCPVCYKLFSNREILKRHVSMHRITSTPINSTITVAQTSITPTSSRSAAAAAAAAAAAELEEGVAGVLGPDGVHDKQCRVCFKEFTRREHVKRHMKLHSGHERYACVACDKVYSRKDQLRQHQRQTHGQVLELELETMDNGVSGEYDQD